MEKDPIARISPIFKGAITISDLLRSDGTLAFKIDNRFFQDSGFLFRVVYHDFIFFLKTQNNSFVLQRNDAISVLTLDELLEDNSIIGIFAMWSYYKLILECRVGDKVKVVEVPTIPTVPPAPLIEWVRKHNLLPTETYKTEEEFREKIHASLITINQKIREADAYKSFWNVVYKGNKIIDRKPKKEVEIQPLIQCFLSDQMLLSNIEVVPEYKTGEGNLDFLFIGQVDDMGNCKFCVEFKLAHSDDLDNGLWYQLPKYMNVSNATYGAYCVLNFKGEWFDQPHLKGGETLDMHLTIIPANVIKPVHQNIRSFIFDLGKPATASKKPY